MEIGSVSGHVARSVWEMTQGSNGMALSRTWPRCVTGFRREWTKAWLQINRRPECRYRASTIPGGDA